ncbi:PKD domain-containing protein [uncultured Arcticibacterium sp.]|uniref:PKD domain-containing protein n=1 Tax=uncultured Arcticibacterium sp. TaxID=2173042 RepID=UPI0030FCB4ED
MKYNILLFMLLFLSCSSKEETKPNLAPIVKLESKLISTSPFTFEFVADALDQEFDPLTYNWDFGNGITKTGSDRETVTFEEGQDYTVSVSVTDGNSNPVAVQVSINTNFELITVNPSTTFQKIEGFGGFGGQTEYWRAGPFNSDRFIKDLVEDLGLTIIRDDVPTNFEIENDNDDPYDTDLSQFNIDKEIDGHHKPFAARIPHLKALREAGVEKFIASVWSPAPWMKWNNDIDNGTESNSAPPFSKTPDETANQLKEENYEEFAESMVAYCRIFKREIGIDLYALSVQNEPRFSQFYQSCIYDGEALNELLKVVGRRLKNEGLSTKLFAPEDVGYFDGVKSMTLPILNDPETREYVDIIATHGYAFDGITAGSVDATTWETMYGWGAEYGKQHWMTETSGYENSLEGSNKLAIAMYTALKYGQVSAWVFWTLSTESLDAYSLMNSVGEKSKRYYVSKQFYKYIRPGALRVEASSTDDILTLAFENEGASTVVMINISETGKAVKLSGGADDYRLIRTGSESNAEELSPISKQEIFVVPAKGVVTLYSGN